MYRMSNMGHERPRSHWDIHTYNAKIEFKIRYEKEFRSFIESYHYFLIHSSPPPPTGGLSILLPFLNNTLPFLNCLIERDDEGRLQTKIDRKKTHTGQYMHYISNQQEHVKVGTIKTLVRRAKIVCSTEESLTNELVCIKKNNAFKWLP